MGSNKSGPLETASKIGKVEVHDSCRSIESATGGSADKNVAAVMKKSLTKMLPPPSRPSISGILAELGQATELIDLDSDPQLELPLPLPSISSSTQDRELGTMQSSWIRLSLIHI